MQNSDPVLRLVELAEQLNPTGVIGDGMVAEFHDAAARARAKLFPPARSCDDCGCALAPHFGGVEEHRGDCAYFLR